MRNRHYYYKKTPVRYPFSIAMEDRGDGDTVPLNARRRVALITGINGQVTRRQIGREIVGGKPTFSRLELVKSIQTINFVNTI